MKVNLMIIGAMKCGTTTLADILDLHPDISVATNKEPHYFSKGDWRHGLDEYHQLFEPNKKYWCDASTTYTCLPEFNIGIWDDIYRYNSQARFIYMVRNPIERIVSNYMHLYERGYINFDFKNALVKEPGIINRGRYYTQIKPYIDRFGKDHVLILNFEDLIKTPDLLVKKACDFLSISTKVYDDIDLSTFHSNKSIGGYKRNYKFDVLEKRSFFRFTRDYMPMFHYKVIGRFFNHPGRRFTQKPIVAEEIEDLIMKMLAADIIEFQKLVEFKFCPEWN